MLAVFSEKLSKSIMGLLTEPVDKHLTVTVVQVAPVLRIPLLSVPFPSIFIPYFPPSTVPGVHVL